jgi:hypothetical protein
MRNSFFLLMGRTRVFWRLREKLRYLQFIGHRTTLGLRDRLSEERKQANTFLRLSRSTAAQIALALLIAVAIQIVGPPFDEVLQVSLLQITSDA